MTSDFLRTVLEWPLSQVKDWLDTVSIGGLVEGEEFNWALLASVVASRARKERSVAWANLALRVYESLATLSPAGNAYSFMLSAMNLRAWMIEKLGAREDEPALDSDAIFAWFQSLAFISNEEAVRLVSSDLSTLPVETLLKLRYIKNALGILSRISEAGVAQKHPELNAWLQIRNSLP